MTREWARFWFAMAIMAAAGVAAAYLALGRPWDLGSVADWLAGSATLLAVWVALRTARHQGALALQVAREERDERLAVLREERIRFSKAILFVAVHAHANLQTITDLYSQSSSIKGMENSISKTEVCKAVSRSLAGLMSVHAPSTRMMRQILDIETSWGIAVNVADLKIQLATPEVERSWAMAMAQLDSTCDRLAAQCLEAGAVISPFDDTYVQSRLARAQATHS